MARVGFGDKTVNTIGELPAVGSQAPDFRLTGKDLKDVSLKDFAGKRLVLNIFPSVGTGVCQAALRRFNAEAGKLDNTVVLCISVDLPFAQKDFCAAEGLDNVITLSAMRTRAFGKDYGVLFTEGGFEGLFSRAVVVVDETGKVIYTEQVPVTSQEPNYEAALAVLK
jgi:thiol peroxidase